MKKRQTDKHILFYYPSNKRTVSLETLFRELRQRGYRVSMLTMCERGSLHDEMESLGIASFSTSAINKRWSFYYYLTHCIKLVKFCRKHKVDVVFSHLQQANLVSSLANYWVKARIIHFRHHDFSRTRNEAIGDFLINRLAKIIVVPSTGVRDLMLKNEKIESSKIILIPYIYDFTKYEFPNKDEVHQLRMQYVHTHQTLLLIMVARLVPAKRHQLVFEVVEKLIKNNYDLQLLVLDEGPEKEYLMNYVQERQLQNHIHFIGYTRKVTTYLAAADLLVHPSLSEASNSAVKEAGLLERAVAVCERVGDFSDYITHGENGFLMKKDTAAQDLEEIIQLIYDNRSLPEQLGKKLKMSVENTFTFSEEIVKKYDYLLN